MSREPLIRRQWLGWMQLGYVATVAVLLTVLPGAPWLMTFVAMMLVGLLAVAGYRRTHAYSPAGEGALTAAMTLLAAGIIINVWYFTTFSGGTDAAPVLHNDDAWRYWNDALAWMGRGGWYAHPIHGNYGMLVAAWMTLTGPSITWALMLNMVCLLIAMIMCSLMTYVLTHEKRTAAIAMIAVAAVCYLMSMGTVLLKDAWVIACVATAGAVLSRWRGWMSVLKISLIAVALAIVRQNYVLALTLGIVVTAFAFERGKQRWPERAVAIALTVAISIVPVLLHIGPYITGTIVPNSDFSGLIGAEGQQHAFRLVVGDYGALPLWQKLILMPITAGVQFLIPFPWNWARDLPFGPTQVYAHLAYPWYLFGAMVLFYLCARKVRRVGLTYFTYWGVVLWLVPCFTAGGTVSRYALPSVVLMAPCVAVVWRECRRRKSFAVWLAVFALAMTVVLLVCKSMQEAYA